MKLSNYTLTAIVISVLFSCFGGEIFGLIGNIAAILFTGIWLLVRDAEKNNLI